MTANTTLNTGSGGDVIRTIDRSGTGPKTQVVQLDVGGGGATETLVSTSAPVPVRLGDGTNQVVLEQNSTDGEATTSWSVPSEAYLKQFNGTTWDRVRGDTTSGLWVNVKNSAVTIQGVQDTATTGTITSAASTVGPLAVTQRNVITISISGTYAGVTFVIEASDDGGTLYYPLQCINNATGQASSTWTPATNESASYDSAVGGYTHLRVRSTAWTSGTANVRMTAQSFAYDPVVAAIATTDNQWKATYTATMARVASGALTANTLKAVMSFETAAAGKKTVRLRSLLVSGYATTALAGTVEFQITRGTAASTAGTAITPQPALPGDPAAVCVVKSLPTITAATVLLAGNATAVPATANSTIGSAFDLLKHMGTSGLKDFTLRAGSLDSLVLNIISTAAVNVTMNVTAIFTEE